MASPQHARAVSVNRASTDLAAGLAWVGPWFWTGDVPGALTCGFWCLADRICALARGS